MQIGSPEEADVEPMDPQIAATVDVGLPLIGVAGLAHHPALRQRFLAERFLRVLSQRQGNGQQQYERHDGERDPATRAEHAKVHHR